MAKRLKLKVRKFWWANSYICRSYRGKTGRGPFWPPWPILNRVKEKSSFKMFGLTFSSKLDWVSCIISIVVTASKKIGALIHSVKFVSPEVALYPYESTICPYMEYCSLTGASSCYLELLDKLQKQICRTFGPSVAAYLEPLARCQNMASLTLFYRYYFVTCSSELG